MVYLGVTTNMRVTQVQAVVVRNLPPFQVMPMSLMMSFNRLLPLQWRCRSKSSTISHSLHTTEISSLQSLRVEKFKALYDLAKDDAEPNYNLDVL